MTGADDLASVLGHLLIPSCLGDEFGIAKDHVQRRAQFVAHIGQEAGLSLIGVECYASGFFHFGKQGFQRVRTNLRRAIKREQAADAGIPPLTNDDKALQ